MIVKTASFLMSSLLLSGLLQGQIQPAQQVPPPAVQSPPQQVNLVDQLRPTYVLRAGDQVLVHVSELEEVSARPFRVDEDGFVDLPVLGRMKASNLTVVEFEKALVEAAKKYVREPLVSVTVVQFNSEPVFFTGAFQRPGIYPLDGSRMLVEMMSSLGGLQADASRVIKITRRKESGAIPLPNAVSLPDGSGTRVEISMASLRESINPAEDIVLKPFDVIRVERAEMVYVAGDVSHIGGFELQDKESMSVLQALIMAGGFGKSANHKQMLILRPVSNTSLRAKVALDYDRILKGEANDQPLFPNDILYVPTNSFNSKSFAGDLRVALPTALGLVSLIISLTR